MNVNLQIVKFENLEKCISVTNGEVELIITTVFGPRVLYYGYIGQKNIFKIFPEQLRDIKIDEWKSYGGHRLWHAPEVFPRTYYPDNEAVAWEWKNGTLVLNCPPEKGNNIGKQILITLADKGSAVTIEHTLANLGVWPIKISAWCLSVMAAGGTAVVPQEEYKSHPECLVPARPLVLWHFTKMNDHRSTWGEKYIQLREDSADRTKQKFGVRNTKGWAAYVMGDVVFMKKMPFFEDAEYTDMGCNQEFYTEAGFLEIESLSPYTELASQGSLTHVEKWLLAKNDGFKTESDFDRLEALSKTI